MPLQQHIEALKAKHADIDEKLQKLEASASADSIEIAKLKQKKLELKDEIEKKLKTHNS